MADVLVEYRTTIRTANSPAYRARACGAPANDGTTCWHGWIEFAPAEGGTSVRTGRETTQPNRICAKYWATGLTPTYLRGALERALNPTLLPKRSTDSAANVADPASLLRRGPSRLRKRLSSMSRRRLVQTLLAYSPEDYDLDELQRTAAPVLIDRIITAIEKQLKQPVTASAPAVVKDDKTIIDLLEHLTGGISVIEGRETTPGSSAPPAQTVEKDAAAKPPAPPTSSSQGPDRQEE